MQNYQPLINIVTRTANRPKGFARLRKSIEAQTYNNIRHIVVYDDDSALEYLQEGQGYELHKIDKEEVLARDRGVNPNTGGYFPYNYYINDAYKLIKEGYFYGIDDDDELLDANVIEDLADVAEEDRLVLAKFQFDNGMVIPLDGDFGKAPKICRIGGSCMFFHIKWVDFAQFDCWKCSDFRVINRLYHSVPKTLFMDRVLMKCNNNGGKGEKIDI
jgi:glycosyltransferase involved in cell wall biosynthesis